MSSASAGKGDVLVEVLDRAGQPIRGYGKGDAKVAKAVDDLCLRPEWQAHADLSALQGKTVRLKIHLTQAKLYSFQIKP